MFAHAHMVDLVIILGYTLEGHWMFSREKVH